MDYQSKPAHSLVAYTYDMDFVPHLYIEGSIPTNGEKPIVTLQEKEPQGINPKILLLEFTIDVYDPKGKSQLQIQNYSKEMLAVKYDSVSIIAKKGNIELQIEHRTRDSETK